MTSKTPSNRAAWLTGAKVSPLQVKQAPYTRPGDNEIVVKVHAIALNLVDGFKQTIGDFYAPWIKYPAILGTDVAGEVVEVGNGATRFRIGDRVTALAAGTDRHSNKASEGAFQEYVVIRTNLVSHIPDFVTYEAASVLPLTLSTAACGMFMKDQLALPYPKVNPKPRGEVFVVWGGSTGVGSNAIQLAIACGYEVIATASPKNYEYVKKLGATVAFDYKSKTAVKDIIKAVGDRTLAGTIAIGQGSTKPCIDIAAGCKGKKFVAQVSIDGGIPNTLLETIVVVFSMNWAKFTTWVKGKVNGIGYKFIWGSDLMMNDVGKAIFEDFLPEALARKQFICAPEHEVVGHGLEDVQKALDILRKSVSAKKIVITV